MYTNGEEYTYFILDFFYSLPLFHAYYFGYDHLNVLKYFSFIFLYYQLSPGLYFC